MSGPIVAGEMAGRGAEVAEGGWEDIARSAANRGGVTEEVELLRELLTLQLDGTPYAIPVERVREIVRVSQVTPVPRVPPSVLGVIALRGEVVQVVDLRMRLGLRASELGRRSRIIVLHGEDDRVAGVLVDAVEAVLRVSEDAIHPTASSDSGAVAEMCVRGEQFVSILELDRVLDLDAD
jgi:chemotaxis signal transduction protein